MFKTDKHTLLLTTLVILLPIAAGLVLWPQLPARLPIHWDTAGQVDGTAPKLLAVLGLPLLIAALHCLCIWGISQDPRRANVPGKMFRVVLWVCPLVSVVCCSMMYAAALGAALDVRRVTLLLVGLVFLMMGNYLPKCRSNYTVGYRVPWTLHDEDNWNRTHRMAGKTFVLGGLLMLLGSFFGWLWPLFTALVLAVVPAVYSWQLYKKNNAG